MSIVDFNSSTWIDPWFRKLPVPAKLLSLYLDTNDHKNLAGLYALDMETMAFETHLTVEQVEQSLNTLRPKVKYDFEQELVWVVDHVKQQFMRTGNISPKVSIGIDKCLKVLPEGHPFIGEFLQKYSNLSIEYPYPIQGREYRSSGGEGEGKDAGKGGSKGKEDKYQYKGNKDINDDIPDECISPDASEIFGK